MKRQLRFRWLSMALAIVVLFGLVGTLPANVNAAAPASYTDIRVGDVKTVTINSSGAMVFFRFIPTYTGTFTFTSSDNYDPVGVLLDANGNEIEGNDDHAGSRAFRLQFHCTAGTVHYLCARMYSGTGSYTVFLTGEADNPDDELISPPVLPEEDDFVGVGAHSYYNSSTGDVFLGGNFIEIGISRHGSFGTSTAPSVSDFHTGGGKLGMIVDGDGWDNGNAPTTGDFFLPDTPEERYIFAYRYGGTTYQYIVADRNNVFSGSWSTAPTVSNQSHGNTLKAVVSGVTIHNIALEITYSFDVNDKFYRTDVKITNNSNSDIQEVRFVRSFDPDQDDDIYNTNYTYNKVICNPSSSYPGSDTNYAMVVARGEQTLEGFFFIAFDNRARASQGVDFAPSSAYMTGLWPETHSYANYATEEAIYMTKTTTNGYSKADTGIAITFNFGTVSSGDDDKGQFYSSMSPTVQDSLEEIMEPVAPVIEEISGATLPHGYREGGPSVSAIIADNHTATYQWYVNTVDSNTGGTLVSGATSPTYNVSVRHATNVTEYYYCVITATRTDNARSATVTSPAVAVYYQDGEHAWEEVGYRDSTCEEAGWVYYACPDCPATYEETLLAPGHEYTEWIVEEEPTCTTSGSKYIYCTRCDRYLSAYMPPIGHSYVSVVTREATCTTPGIITHTCTNCGDSFLTYVYSEHNYQLTEHCAASCDQDGYNLYTCLRCEETRTEIIPGSHNYVSAITKVATSTEDGEITYTCSICGDCYTEVIPARPEAKVLLVQDRLPWDENNNVALLNKMVTDGYITGWDATTTSAFGTVNLGDYGVILIANDQSTATYRQLEVLQSTLVEFANAGGVVIYGACSNGWAGGSINYTLPEGVTVSNFYSNYNYIVDTDHPVVLGNYTDGKALTNSLLYGNYCSHSAFRNLPDGANVILQDGHGDPTLVEYSLGNGHFILSGLTWEFYYTRSAYDGRSHTTYTRNVYDDLIVYALQLSDPCDHLYDEGVTVLPTCEEDGYTIHTCELCGGTMKDSYVSAYGHQPGEWSIVREATEEESGLKVIYCTTCDEVLRQEILPAYGAPVVTVTAPETVILGQTFEAYILISDCGLVKSAAFTLYFDETLFELVSVEWMTPAAIQVTDPEIASAWVDFTDINGELLKIVFRATALTDGSELTADAYIQNDGVISLTVVGGTVAVVECPHETFVTSSMDDEYHLSTCTVCGYTTVSAHSFDHDCDTGCNGCAYTREITHRTGDQFYDENAHWYECSVCGEVLEYELHQYYNTCDADCNVCGAVREIEHTPCETWGHDDSRHWLDCSVCGMTLESHEHIYDGRFDQICDTCGYKRILRGDMDDDGDVDYDDAVYLLLYTYFPERYPLNQAGDMDGNGVIDSDDAIRVLQYAESPDLYPLA